MHYFKFLILFALASCVTTTNEKSNVYLGDILSQEILQLKNANKTIEKTVYLNNTISDTLLSKVDWDVEFTIFFDLLPSKNEFTAYEKKELKEENKRKVFHTLTQEKKTQVIEEIYLNGELKSIRIEKKEEDYLSYQTIQLFYELGKSIGMKNISKIKGQKEIILESFCKIN